jgi:hypothetical protein
MLGAESGNHRIGSFHIDLPESSMDSSIVNLDRTSNRRDSG